MSFVTGFSGSGKSYRIKEKIKRLINETDKRIVLIVPEQFSFESEREMYSLLGAQMAKRAEVYSFTRLADKIFKTYGGIAGKTADKTDKLVFMNAAVNELKDDLDYFSKAAKYKSFAASMLGAAEEIKNAGASAEELKSAAQLSGDGALLKKTEEILTLFDTYNAILEKSRVDPSDCLDRAEKKLRGTGFFNGSTVFFDEFKSFTGAQLKLIAHIVKHSDDCVFSLCMEKNRGEIFSVVEDTFEKIKRIAREQGVAVAAPEELTVQRRFSREELSFAEKNLLSSGRESYGGENSENIKFALADNIFEEAEYAAATLCELVYNEKYRYKDFAVIINNAQIYAPVIKSTFENYGIVYYFDSPDGIKDTPVIKFVTELLKLASGGFDPDSVFSLLRCGFSPFTQEEIDEFENYCFVWNIKGAAFKTEFKANPNGFDEKFSEEDAKKLERFNAVREYILKICAGIKHASGKTAEQIGKAVFLLIEEFEIGLKIEQIVKDEQTDAREAERYARAWEVLLDILDSVASSSGEAAYSLSEYLDIFDFACSQYDMGTVPQLADAVTIGDPERIRMDAARVVFVLGAQKDSFPKLPASVSVFSEAEQKDLLKAGISLFKPFSYRYAEQKFNAYKILSMASDRLYVCASLTGLGGEELYPSDVFYRASGLFGDEALVKVSKLGAGYFCRNKKTAFLALAKNFHSDTQEISAIEAFLKTDEVYSGKLKLLNSSQNQAEARVSEAGSKGAVLKNLRVSPSSFERFYQCKFKYFCCDGLRVRKRQKAKLGPLSRGNVIHDVLECMLKDPSFYVYSQSELTKAAGKRLDEYLRAVMSGEENKTGQFKYLYSRLRKTIAMIAGHMQKELMQSAFRPADFELDIGSKEVGAPEFEFEGVRVAVSGKIDRVDAAVINGKNYVRVVDYKSGGKEFDITDILTGQNMQTLIYLFCICENGSGKYENAHPAGILYMPAVPLRNNAGRNSDNAEEVKNSQYKMKGLVLNDEDVLNAMEAGVSGMFIPAKLSKSGELSAGSSVAGERQFDLLFKYAESSLKKMVMSLRRGDVCAVPLKNGEKTACDFCDYRSVCGVAGEDDAKVAEKADVDKAEIFRIIEKEQNFDEQ